MFLFLSMIWSGDGFSLHFNKIHELNNRTKATNLTQEMWNVDAFSSVFSFLRRKTIFVVFWFALFSIWNKISSVKISQICSIFVTFSRHCTLRFAKHQKRNLNKYVFYCVKMIFQNGLKYPIMIYLYSLICITP